MVLLPNAFNYTMKIVSLMGSSYTFLLSQELPGLIGICPAYVHVFGGLQMVDGEKGKQ